MRFFSYLIPLTTVCILFSIFSQKELCAQNFLDEDNFWTYFSPGIQGFIPDRCIHYKVEGDTTINSTEYKFILQSFDLEEWANADFNYYREDSTGRVFRYSSFFEAEELIYDFNVEVGDTIDYESLNATFNCKGTVLAIDSVTLYNGETRKRIEVRDIPEDFQSDYWIQGIGSLNDLIDHFGSYCYTDYFGYLAYQYLDGETVYQHPDSIVCPIETGIKDLSLSQGINVYPNPIKRGETLLLDSFSERAHLYSLDGQTILKENNTTHLNIPKHMAPGLYVLHLQNEKSTQIIKVMVF